ADDVRFFAILELLRRGESTEKIHDKTEITQYFLNVLEKLIQLENKAKGESIDTVSTEFLSHLKENGFSDAWLASVWNVSLERIRTKRKSADIIPVFQM